MTTEPLDNCIAESASQLRAFNDELKILDRSRKLDPDVRSLLYSARDALRNQNSAFREVSRGIRAIEARLAEWR